MLAICKQLPDCLRQYANAGLVAPIMRMTQTELDQVSSISCTSANTRVILELLDYLAANSELRDEPSLVLNEIEVVSTALHLGNLISAGASDLARTDRSSADQGGSRFPVHSIMPYNAVLRRVIL